MTRTRTANPSQGSTNIQNLLINYNARFAKGGKAMFRDSLVEQTMAVLIGKNKPNALLVGSAGVGKTKIVEDIAYRIASGDAAVPPMLAKSTIYELPLSSLVAGCMLAGMLESKLNDVIDFAADKKNDAILFIDEIHLLTGESQTYGKIAQILKPAMARGDLRVIGATTTQEASTLIDDPAFNRRFSRVIVDELTREQTIEVMKCARPSLIKHYGKRLVIGDDIIEAAAIAADRYLAAGNHRPDTGLTLLDRTCGEVVVQRLRVEVECMSSPDPVQQQNGQVLRDNSICLCPNHLRRTARLMSTGHATRDKLDVESLREKLARIKGQTAVLEDLVGQLRCNDLDIYPKARPLTFLFAGASGVGKTEVAKVIAEELTGLPPITLNMTEYNTSATINRIVGAPAGYVGSDSKRELPFDALEANPYQVILLDEFEKADNSVQRLFMGVFDEGTLKTANGRTVDFSKTIIVATTNAGHTVRKSNPMGFAPDAASACPKQADLVKALSDWFDVELLNRFSKIYTFNEISREVYRDILVESYSRDIARVKAENRRITLPDKLDDETLERLVEQSYIPNFGARPVRKTVQDHIEQSILNTL